MAFGYDNPRPDQVDELQSKLISDFGGTERSHVGNMERWPLY